MSTDTAALTTARRHEPVDVQSGWLWTIRDSWTEATRHLRVIPRNIELVLFSAIQPIMFVLLFAYVFGGSIEVAGFSDYDQYLLPGIMAQTVVFGSSFTSIGLAEDLQKGLVDRLRSLPMSRAAVIIGRTVSDLCRNVFTFVIMLVVAFAVGFRVEGSLLEALAATLLLLFFAYALSWVQAYIGLAVKSTEAANSAGFIWMFPLTFVSSAFVDTRNMPGWLRPIADANPFTVVTNAGRALYNGLDAGRDVVTSLLWSVGITAVFGAISIRKFARSTSG
jgi:ABC-2 type transport system permease protein/oleandomycin transport system permease protein